MNFANHVDLAAREGATRPAVGDGEELLTYGELADETDAAANAFAERGVEPGDRVAICLPNRVAFLTAYLGAMKRGAVPVPVNTQFNDQQMRYVLDTSAASVLVTDAEFAGLARDVETAVTTDGSVGADYRDLLADAADEYDVHPRRRDETAEVLYTSGTTGRPKGVRHTHGNLRANAFGIIECMDWTRREVGVTVCRCFHVTGLNVTTTPLLVANAQNHLLPEWDPESFLATAEAHGATYAFFLPSMLMDLLSYGGVDAYDLSSLTTVGVGGSPMPEKRVGEVERALGCTLLEGYGMTETTPLAAFSRRDADERKPGSVGPPAREVVDLRIEDLESREPVERGEHGELLWRGDTVTPGYEREYGDGQLFVERDGERWLRSGDVGRLDEDGHLFVVDRREDMFTTGCANVFPREIEDVLYGIDGVAEAAVIDTSDDLRGAVVTAIVSRTDETLATETVVRACEAELADHEVPQRVEFVDGLPKTATGKIDRVSLRERYD